MRQILRPVDRQEDTRFERSHTEEDLDQQIHACEEVRQRCEPVRQRLQPGSVWQPPCHARDGYPEVNNAQHGADGDLPQQSLYRCGEFELPCCAVDAVEHGADAEDAEMVPRTPFRAVALLDGRLVMFVSTDLEIVNVGDSDF